MNHLVGCKGARKLQIRYDKVKSSDWMVKLVVSYVRNMTSKKGAAGRMCYAEAYPALLAISVSLRRAGLLVKEHKIYFVHINCLIT